MSIKNRVRSDSIKKILIFAFVMFSVGIPHIEAQPSSLSLNLRSSVSATTINSHFTLTGTSTPPINGSIRLLVGQGDSMMVDSGASINLKNGVWSKELWFNQTADWTFRILFYGNGKYDSASSNIVKVSITTVSTPPNSNPGTSPQGSTSNSPGQTTSTGGVPGYPTDAILVGVVFSLVFILKKTKV